ncbi:MAG: LytTR family DNA-binding domain-containing protein [Clostridia bacterium]|nr:LytTR family DNA-binding domain-containing protein [Clostridia bacterium]
MNILLAEDDIRTRSGLKKIISSIDCNVTVIETGKVSEALNVFKKVRIDLFILDIQLEDGSGLDLAKKIREMDDYKLSHIVFITAIPSREQIAFKDIHCYDYIIKPFDISEVTKTLDTLIRYSKKDIFNTKFKIKQKGITYIYPFSDIIMFESNLRKIYMTSTKEVVRLSKITLNELLKGLPVNFVQCHRGFIINKDYVEKIDSADGTIMLKGVENKVPIGMTYKENVMEYGETIL